MNVDNLDVVNPCTSCQMCGAVCPTGAISIQLNKEGFYRTVVDNEKCIDCGLCTKICYKYDQDISVSSGAALNKMDVYAAYAKDEDVLHNTTSGGVADVLCRKMIEKGYICVGVAYDVDKDVAVNKIAKNEQETEAFRGSKYIQSYSVDAFKEIVHSHSDNLFAVFGTPCHIYAINKYLTRTGRRSNVLLIDIFCHGCPSMNLWKKYVDVLKTKVVDYDKILFRSKYRGWGSFCVSAEKGGKTVYASKKINDAFYSLFFSNLVLNDACADCKLRSTFEYADIRLGDFWGKSYDLNTKGVSIVVGITGKGKKAIDEIKNDVVLNCHSHQDYMPYQSFGESYMVDSNKRKNLMVLLSDPDTTLSQVINSFYSHQTLKIKVKRHVKNLVLLMPQSLMNRIKKMYH